MIVLVDSTTTGTGASGTASATAGSTGASSSSSSSSSSSTSRDKVLVDDLLAFQERMECVLRLAFGNHEGFRYALKSAFEHFLNLQQNRPAKVLADFVDRKVGDDPVYLPTYFAYLPLLGSRPALTLPEYLIITITDAGRERTWRRGSRRRAGQGSGDDVIDYKPITLSTMLTSLTHPLLLLLCFPANVMYVGDVVVPISPEQGHLRAILQKQAGEATAAGQVSLLRPRESHAHQGIYFI